MLSTKNSTESPQMGGYAEPLKFLLAIMVFSIVMLAVTILMMWGMGAILGDNFNAIFLLDEETPFWWF